MTTETQLEFRHSLRPLNVFSFCGQPVAAPRAEYLQATRDLPPCPNCRRAQDAVARTLGGNLRPPGLVRAIGSSTAT